MSKKSKLKPICLDTSDDEDYDDENNKHIINKKVNNVLKNNDTYIDNNNKLNEVGALMNAVNKSTKLNDNVFTFTYENKELICIKDNNNIIWFKAKDIGNILMYNDTTSAIKTHVNIKNKIEYRKLIFKVGDFLTLENTIHPQTIFITQKGMFELIFGSKLKSSEKFKDWIFDEVIPSINQYGTYSLNKKPIEYKKFYNDNSLSTYTNKNVIYLAYIDKYNNEECFKFGLSSDFPRRELLEHRKTFKIFDVVYIFEADNMNELEKMLKIEFNANKILRKITIDKKNYTEIVAFNDIFTIEPCIKLIEILNIECKSNQTIKYEKELNEKNNQIKLLQIELKYANNIINDLRSQIKALFGSKNNN